MNIPAFDITGQKALLVGAGRGIGNGIALAFAEAGAEVAVTGLTTTGVGKVPVLKEYWSPIAPVSFSIPAE